MKIKTNNQEIIVSEHLSNILMFMGIKDIMTKHSLLNVIQTSEVMTIAKGQEIDFKELESLKAIIRDLDDDVKIDIVK